MRGVAFVGGEARGMFVFTNSYRDSKVRLPAVERVCAYFGAEQRLRERSAEEAIDCRFEFV